MLVVGDEAAILELARESLQHLGYTVLAASSPEEAMRRSEEQAGVNGRQLEVPVHVRLHGGRHRASGGAG